MKNLPSLPCECGQIHKQVPRDAVFAKAGEHEVVRWYCACRRELNIGSELVEFKEMMGILWHSKFKGGIQLVREANKHG